MPATRFLGYIEKMNEVAEERNKTDRERKVDSLKNTMTPEDRKRYEEEYG